MTIYEKAVHELQRQGLASAYTHDNEVWVNAWVDDLECTISISVHDIQIMNLADDYDEHIEETKTS